MTTVSKDFQKVLVGAFAFVMVSSMIFPAYAGAPEELVIKCYPIVDGQIDPPPIFLTDQFGSEQVDPGLPVFTCEIAVKNGISAPFTTGRRADRVGEQLHSWRWREKARTSSQSSPHGDKPQGGGTPFTAF